MKMKRLTVLMAVCLCMSVLTGFSGKTVKEQTNDPAVQAAADAAEDNAAEDEQSNVWKIPSAGMDITVPESWTSSGFYISYRPTSITPELILTSCLIYSATEEELDSVIEEYGDESEESRRYFDDHLNDLFLIFSVNDALSRDDVKKLILDDNPGISFDLEEIGKADGWSFYNVLGEKILRRSEPSEDRKETMDKVMADLPGLFENIRFYKPEKTPRTEEGTAVSFETVDFDGNKVDSRELFAKNKYTMINLWMSWCHYCVEEMPVLEKMNEEYAADGIGIIGVMLDGDQEKELETGRKIKDDTGVTYPLLVPTESMKKQLIAVAYPTTIFVDSEGIVVGDPIEGMNLKGYRDRIEELLEEDSDADQVREENAREADSKETAANGASEVEPVSADDFLQSLNNEYHIVVRNEEGEPVPGAYIQFCSESQCMMNITNGDGIAAFSADAGKYTAHILSVPEGYQDDETEYDVPAEPGDVFLVLKKK